MSIYWKRVEINEQKIKKLISKLQFQARIHLIYWIFIDEASYKISRLNTFQKE